MSVHESLNFLDSLAVFLYRTRANIFWWIEKKRSERKERKTKMDFFNKISLSNSSSWRHLKPLSCVRSTSLHVSISVVFSLLISSLIQIRNLSISMDSLRFILHRLLAQSKASASFHRVPIVIIPVVFVTTSTDETIWQLSFLLMNTAECSIRIVASPKASAHTLEAKTEQFA